MGVDSKLQMKKLVIPMTVLVCATLTLVTIRQIEDSKTSRLDARLKGVIGMQIVELEKEFGSISKLSNETYSQWRIGTGFSAPLPDSDGLEVFVMGRGFNVVFFYTSNGQVIKYLRVQT